MASTSNGSDKPTPPPQQRPQPPNSDDVFNCIRRFTEHHIASILHSLIGLPTMLPPSSTWIMDDESPQTANSGPAPGNEKNSSPGGSAIIAATEVLKNNDSSPPPSQSTRGRMAECFLLTDPRTFTPIGTLFRPEEEERLAAVWRQTSLLYKDFTAPFFGGDVFGTGMGKGAGIWQDPFLIAPLFWSVGIMGNEKRMYKSRTGEETESQVTAGEDKMETELDAYNHLAPSTASSNFLSTSSATSSFSSHQTTTDDPNKPQVVATAATTHSYTSSDGVTRTKYVLKKRFADGSEERVEEDHTTFVGVPRVTEIR